MQSSEAEFLGDIRDSVNSSILMLWSDVQLSLISACFHLSNGGTPAL